jgi:hypothetical protein
MTWFLVAHEAIRLVDIPGGCNPNSYSRPLSGWNGWTTRIAADRCRRV